MARHSKRQKLHFPGASRRENAAFGVDLYLNQEVLAYSLVSYGSNLDFKLDRTKSSASDAYRSEDLVRSIGLAPQRSCKAFRGLGEEMIERGFWLRARLAEVCP